MTLFDRLKTAAGEVWPAYVDHAFVRGLGRGDLPAAAFRHYLVQDYLFLIHFARAYALVIYKSATLQEMREGLSGVQGILGETSLHLEYCAEWGLDADAVVAAAEDPATVAYTRFVLDRGHAGDLLDLHVALAPCVVGYAEIGARLAADPATRREGNPYSRWIAEYSGETYQQIGAEAVARLDRLWAERGGEARFHALAQNFTRATQLEADFWRMGLRAAAPVESAPAASGPVESADAAAAKEAVHASTIG